MGKVEALKELLASAERGEYNGAPFNHHMNVRFTEALDGSLDAAMELHKEMIPENSYLIGVDWAEVWVPNSGDIVFYSASNKTPARAWLIAILKALIAQGKATR